MTFYKIGWMNNQLFTNEQDAVNKCIEWMKQCQKTYTFKDIKSGNILKYHKGNKTTFKIKVYRSNGTIYCTKQISYVKIEIN